MKLMFGPPLFYLFLHCATQASGLTIQAFPGVDGDGVVQTELNKTVSLVCQPGSSYAHRANEELVWLRNGALVSLKEGNKEGRSSVCVTPAIHEDNGANFTCHLHNNVTVSASVILNITYPPQVSGSEQVKVEEESELVLTCDIWANPPVSSVSWTQNGSKVDLEAGGFTVTNDAFTSQLSADGAKRGFHEGTYQCLAISPKYGEHTKIFHVTLTDKTLKFPLMPMIAGLVVLCLTAILAIASRWKKIAKCFKCRK